MKVLTDNQYYGQIANVIREQNGTNNTYTPPQMVRALIDLFYEEVEGVPPISFQGIGENLLDYRIDGASGGVGDKTNNLFDGIFLHRSVIGNTIGTDDVNRRSIAIDISNYNNGEKITFSRDTGVGSVFQMYQISSIKTGGKLNNENVISGNSNTLLATTTITNVNEYPYLMIFLNGANNPIEDEELIASKIMINVGNAALPYEPYGYKVPVVISGKNLFNEITYQGAVNNSGNIVDSTKRIRSEYIDVDENETYTCSSNLKIRIIYAYNNEYNKVGCIYDGPLSGKVVTFVMPIGATKIMISFMDAGDPNNEITPNDFLWGQLEKGSIATDYEPYHEPTITNIYLDEPIGENESISLSDTNVNIPTIRGTNVLTVDTTVQPNNVYVKSRHESSYETAMRERYEEAQAQLDALESGGK